MPNAATGGHVSSKLWHRGQAGCGAQIQWPHCAQCCTRTSPSRNPSQCGRSSPSSRGPAVGITGGVSGTLRTWVTRQPSASLTHRERSTVVLPPSAV